MNQPCGNIVTVLTYCCCDKN